MQDLGHVLESSGERRLQDLLGTRDKADGFYRRQVLDHLNGPMREFIARQEMMFVATSDARGSCDNTFRAGPPGFVTVLDERHLAWPEYRGNGVLASLGNITENPQVGLLFVDFFDAGVGLHVNGGAQVRQEPPPGWVADDDVPGRRAQVWVVASVDEAYIHCAKHIPRLRRVTRHASLTAFPTKKSEYFVGAAAQTGPDDVVPVAVQDTVSGGVAQNA